MTRSLSRDRWSDGGDPAKARRLAQMWVFYAIAAWAVAGFIWFAWWIAQVNNYQDNWRGFNEGDGFPWIAVAMCLIAGVWCVPIARTQRARAHYLEQSSQGR